MNDLTNSQIVEVMPQKNHLKNHEYSNYKH